MSENKIVSKISKIVLLITVVNIYSFFVYKVNTQDDANLGFLPLAIKHFSRIPENISNTLQGISEETHGEEDLAFKIKNKLDYDLYALNGNFMGPYWEINLKNLKNDSVIKKWRLNKSDFIQTERFFDRTGPRTPIILPDESLILTMDESNNMYRIDKNSTVKWRNTDHQYHHSINLSADGNIWACTRKRINLKKQNINYWQNGIAKIDVNTGEVLYHETMYEILYNNNLQYLIHGSSNAINRLGHDPTHLNDIEPIVADGPYWKKGDLLLSLRNKSLILLYRPSNKKIIRTIQGPFFNQHDVDIVNDSTISLFNNNVTSLRKIKNFTGLSENDFSVNDTLTANSVSGVMSYSFSDSTFSSTFPNQFASEGIYSETEGLHHFTKKGDLFIESQNNGRIYIINDEEIILRDYMNDPIDGKVELSHWIRIYEDLKF